MNYDVIRHSASSLKPRLKFWKYNPSTKTVYFTATTKDGDRQYPIGISKLQNMNPSSIRQALSNSLAKFGVVHDDQLVKAVNDVLSMSHSAIEEEEMDVIDVSEEVLEHSISDAMPNRFYFLHLSNPSVTNGKIEFNLAFNYGRHKFKGATGQVVYTPNVYFVYDTENRPTREQLAKEIKPAIFKMALSYATAVSKEEVDKAIDAAYAWVRKAPSSNTPITPYSPYAKIKEKMRGSSVSHALFTEVYDMDDYLEHHGILGMKWGVRRYQNEDGSLTEAGRKHYAKNSHNSPLVPHPTKWSHSHNYKNLREDVKSTDNVIEKKALATSAQVSNMTRTANRNFLTSLAGSSLSAGATATLALLEASEGLILGAAAAPLAVAGAINLGRSIYSIYNSVRIGNIEKRIEWDAEDERILKELEKEQSK